MYKIIFFLMLCLVILRYNTMENFILACNVPYRTSEKCFQDKFYNCLNNTNDKKYCQNLSNLQCTAPVTISSNFPYNVQCIKC